MPPTSAASITPSIVPNSALCARTTYILLAVIPALFGIFGIHNLVAGFVGRGIAQLVLSVLAGTGSCAALAVPDCCCMSVQIWLGLLAWVVCEAATMTRDARGAPMR
jgi:hypothetical protein